MTLDSEYDASLPSLFMCVCVSLALSLYMFCVLFVSLPSSPLFALFLMTKWRDGVSCLASKILFYFTNTSICSLMLHFFSRFFTRRFLLSVTASTLRVNVVLLQLLLIKCVETASLATVWCDWCSFESNSEKSEELQETRRWFAWEKREERESDFMSLILAKEMKWKKSEHHFRHPFQFPTLWLLILLLWMKFSWIEKKIFLFLLQNHHHLYLSSAYSSPSIRVVRWCIPFSSSPHDFHTKSYQKRGKRVWCCWESNTYPAAESQLLHTFFLMQFSFSSHSSR